MTINGGQPHKVGYDGQQYEISVFDAEKNKRIVLGWCNDPKHASDMATNAELRPSWSLAWVTDLFADEQHDGHPENSMVGKIHKGA